jgi:hypothetical protein
VVVGQVEHAELQGGDVGERADRDLLEDVVRQIEHLEVVADEEAVGEESQAVEGEINDSEVAEASEGFGCDLEESIASQVEGSEESRVSERVGDDIVDGVERQIQRLEFGKVSKHLAACGLQEESFENFGE